MNHHVNNVKYVTWMLEVIKCIKEFSSKPNSITNLENWKLGANSNLLALFPLQTIPHKLLEKYQLSHITLEYRRECGSSDIVQSLCQPEDENLELRTEDSTNAVNGDSLASNLFQDCSCNKSIMQRYTHLLQIAGEKMEEIVRGRTTWKRKL